MWVCDCVGERGREGVWNCVGEGGREGGGVYMCMYSVCTFECMICV